MAGCSTFATASAYDETKRHIEMILAKSSYRELGRRYKVSFTALRDIKAGRWNHVSFDTLVLIRYRLGLPDLPDVVEVPPCPDCGSVHTGRCHGLPVASVVVLAPGDVVTHDGNGAEPAIPKPAKPRAPRKQIEVTPKTHGKHAILKEAHQTWDTLEDELADVAAQLDAARLPGENRVSAIKRLTA